MDSDRRERGGRPSWRRWSRRVLVGAVLLAVGVSIGASVRQGTGGRPAPHASAPAREALATGLPPGLAGSLLVLTGSSAGLPGGASGELLWRIDLASGRVAMGPAEAAQSVPEQASGPTGYPGFMYGFPAPPPMIATPRLVAVYQPGGQNAFLATAPLSTSRPTPTSFAETPLQAVATVGNYAPGAGGRIGFVADQQGAGGRTIQQVGIVGRSPAFQGQAPRLLIADAFPLRRGLYVAAARGRGPYFRNGATVVARVAHGRLRVVSKGWLAIAEDPTGRGLLVVPRPRVIGSPPPPRAFLWRPGARPAPLLAPSLSVSSVLAWSSDGRVLLVSGRLHGRSGLVLATPGGRPAPLPLPAGVHAAAVTSAAFAGDGALFFTNGLSLYVEDLATGGGVRPVSLPGELAQLAALAVAYAGPAP